MYKRHIYNARYVFTIHVKYTQNDNLQAKMLAQCRRDMRPSA